MRLPWPAMWIASLLAPLPAWAQERGFEWQWDVHPIWWPFAMIAVSLLLLVLFGWVLLNLAPLILGAIAAVLGIRWLTRVSRSTRHDPAIALLRERYARGEITRDEFGVRMRDLDGRPCGGASAERAGRASGRRRGRWTARRRGDAMEVGAVGVGLAPHRGAAHAAGVVVLVAGGQHEEELLAHRGRPLAARAEEARGFQLAEAVGHGLYCSLGVEPRLARKCTRLTMSSSRSGCAAIVMVPSRSDAVLALKPRRSRRR